MWRGFSWECDALGLRPPEVWVGVIVISPYASAGCTSGRGVPAEVFGPGDEGFADVLSVLSARAVVVAEGHGSGAMLNALGYGRVLAAFGAWSSTRERDNAFLSMSLLDVADGRGVADVGVRRCRGSDELASSLGCVATVTVLLESSAGCAGSVWVAKN